MSLTANGRKVYAHGCMMASTKAFSGILLPTESPMYTRRCHGSLPSALVTGSMHGGVPQTQARSLPCSHIKACMVEYQACRHVRFPRPPRLPSARLRTVWFGFTPPFVVWLLFWPVCQVPRWIDLLAAASVDRGAAARVSQQHPGRV